jgi:hypothetical protein
VEGNFFALVKTLSERVAFLWAGTLLAILLLAARSLGYLQSLDTTVVTTAILTGLFFAVLLVTIASGHLAKHAREHFDRRRFIRDDQVAMRNFETRSDLQRDVLIYATRNEGQQTFSVPCNRKLLSEMVRLKLIDYAGPEREPSGLTQHRVRGNIWQKMLEDGWQVVDENSPPLPEWERLPWE